MWEHYIEFENYFQKYKENNGDSFSQNSSDILLPVLKQWSINYETLKYIEFILCFNISFLKFKSQYIDLTLY